MVKVHLCIGIVPKLAKGLELNESGREIPKVGHAETLFMRMKKKKKEN